MIKKALTLACLIFLGIGVNAQESNRWKETQRLGVKDKPVAYTDTLHILKVENNEISLRDGGFLYKAKIEKDKVDFIYRSFTVVKNDNKVIKLKDEEYVHVFTKEAKDLSAADAAEGKMKVSLPAHPVKKIDNDLLSGSWKAYKRENRSGPSSQVSNQSMMTSFEYDGVSKEVFLNGNKGGNVILKAALMDDGIIKIKNNQNQSSSLTVWKLEEDELILEDENGIIYYLKKFDK